MAPSKSSPKEEALPPRNSKLVAQAKIAPIERKLESQVRSKRQCRAMYQDYVSQCAAYGLKVLHYLLLITFLSNAIQVFVPAHTFNENFFFGIRKSVADRYTSICSKWRDVLGRVFPGGWGIFEVTWGGCTPNVTLVSILVARLVRSYRTCLLLTFSTSVSSRLLPGSQLTKPKPSVMILMMSWPVSSCCASSITR